MPGKKSKSSRRFVLKEEKKRFSNKISDGFREKQVEKHFEKNIKDLTEEKGTTPEFLIAMVGILHNIEEMNELQLSQYEWDSVEKRLKKPISHIIKVSKGLLEGTIIRHLNDMFEDILPTVVQRSVLNILFNPLSVVLKETDEYKERLRKKGKGAKAEIDVLQDMVRSMTSQGSEYLLTFINKDYIRKAMKEIYKDLDIESWFRTYDLMESINSFLFSKDDSKLQLFLTQYTPLFLTSKNLHSKIVIFKELEENLRDLKHHSGSIMSEYMRMEMGVLPDDFFDLLSSYGEPNLEEWNEEMKELLESS